MAAKSTSTSSLVPSEVGSGRPIPAATGPSAVVDPTAIVEVNDSQIEDVEPEQEKTPMEPYGPNAVEGVEVAVGSVEVAKSSPPKEPIHLNYYARMALEADAQAAAAAASVAEKAEDPKKEDIIPKTQKGDNPKEHHILSPYAEKVLTRTEQDALYVEKGGRTKGRGAGKGKGRGKGKGKGRGGKGRGGKGRGKGSKTPKSSPAPKPKTRKVKKDLAARELFRSDDESWQEVPKSQRLKRPAAAKSKVNPKSKAKSEKPKTEKDAVKKGEGKGVAEPKPKRTRTSHAEIEIPIFSKCTVIPYWSRVACGLKVPSHGSEDEPKTGLKQVFYIGIKGASMAEHIDIIVEIVPGIYFNG